jgi:hypothetical protein
VSHELSERFRISFYVRFMEHRQHIGNLYYSPRLS